MQISFFLEQQRHMSGKHDRRAFVTHHMRLQLYLGFYAIENDIDECKVQPMSLVSAVFSSRHPVFPSSNWRSIRHVQFLKARNSG